MTQKAKQIEVPNVEATSDGKRMFTPKQWLESFQQNTKGKYQMDNTERIRGAQITQNGWTDKETEVQNFIWGIGPEALLPNDMGRVQNRTG